MKYIEYKEEFKGSVIFLLSNKKTPDFSNKKRIIWDWQYNENPYVNKLSKGILLYEKGKVAGFTGLMPVHLKYENIIVEAYWSIDAIIDHTYRGKGYGGIMVDEVKVMLPVVMALGISNIQAHIRKKHGFKVNKEIEEYFFVIKANSLKNTLKKLVQHINAIKNISNKPRKTTGFDIRIIDASNPPEEIEVLWDKVQYGYHKIVIRNYSYIMWKYGKNPINKYELILVERDHKLLGVGVFRRNVDCSKLVDYIGPAEDLHIKYLIGKTFKNECSHSNLLSCICTDKEFKKVLKTLGFSQHRDRPRFYVFSNLINDQEPEKNWFIMQGDSDGDFSEF